MFSVWYGGSRAAGSHAVSARPWVVAAVRVPADVFEAAIVVLPQAVLLQAGGEQGLGRLVELHVQWLDRFR